MKKVYVLLLVLLVLDGVAVLFLPLWLLRPFQPQTTAEVALAFELTRVAPVVTLGSLLLGAAAAVLFWKRRPSWWARIPVLVLLFALGGLAYASRINFFEKLFAPMEEARFVPVSEAGHLVPEEMVMGVAIASEAKAYPVGMMAYHHVLNDVVAGVPLVVTY